MNTAISGSDYACCSRTLLNQPLEDKAIMDNVTVKPETRNHKGFFVQEASYQLMGIDRSGWALICVENSCQYVDPDNLESAPDVEDALD
jgi:hypothetical protein